MIIKDTIIRPNGDVEALDTEVADNYFETSVVVETPTLEERTTALEATQSDVIDILASALGVTI